MGEEDVLDEGKVKKYPVGSFIAILIKMHHYAGAKEDPVVQLHGIGPWGSNISMQRRS